MANGSGTFSGNFSSIEGLLDHLTQRPVELPCVSNSFDLSPWKTIGMMAQACLDSDVLGSFVQLSYWINVIQFASQLLR